MFLWKGIRNKFLVLVWFGAVALPALGMIWNREHLPILMWLIVPAFILYCAGSIYMCVGIARQMDEDASLSPWEATKRSYGSPRLLLSFLPIIEALFEPDEDKTHYDPDED
jgi:predicted acyltransferase